MLPVRCSVILCIHSESPMCLMRCFPHDAPRTHRNGCSAPPEALLSLCCIKDGHPCQKYHKLPCYRPGCQLWIGAISSARLMKRQIPRFFLKTMSVSNTGPHLDSFYSMAGRQGNHFMHVFQIYYEFLKPSSHFNPVTRVI